MKYGTGWKKQRPDPRDYIYKMPWDEMLESAYDLSALFPPSYDQNGFNSCTGDSAGGAYHYLALAQGLKGFEPSRMFIYYNARAIEQNADQDDGAEIRNAIKGLAKLGVPDEDDWAYTEDHIRATPPPEIYAMAKQRVLLQYSAIPDDITQADKQSRLMSCLKHRIPVVFGFMVFKSIESDAVVRSGRVPMPRRNETPIGGHAVVLTGYKDGIYKFRNSWSPQWGHKGSGYLDAAFVHNPDLASDFWAMFSVKKALVAQKEAKA